MRARRQKHPAKPPEAWVATRLIAELFAGYEEGDPITVLDLGPGNASTLAFLSRFRAKIVFADLLDNPALRHPDEDVSVARAKEIIGQQLAVPTGMQFDICLLWDYLHYLDIPTMEALSAVLQPLFHNNTRGYGFGTLHGKKPDDAYQYGIADPAQLCGRPIPDEPQYRAHSQQRVGDHFLALRIARGTLLRAGRLELLFEAP